MCERNIFFPPLVHPPNPPTGTWLETQACALTRNQRGDLSVCRTTSNPLCHTSQGYLVHSYNNIAKMEFSVKQNSSILVTGCFLFLFPFYVSFGGNFYLNSICMVWRHFKFQLLKAYPETYNIVSNRIIIRYVRYGFCIKSAYLYRSED